MTIFLPQVSLLFFNPAGLSQLIPALHIQVGFTCPADTKLLAAFWPLIIKLNARINCALIDREEKYLLNLSHYVTWWITWRKAVYLIDWWIQSSEASTIQSVPFFQLLSLIPLSGFFGDQLETSIFFRIFKWGLCC